MENGIDKRNLYHFIVLKKGSALKAKTVPDN